ncbi:MAG: DNA double-strand break repair nuclease NurA [Chloroflexota bacterium]
MPLDALQVGAQVRALSAHLESRREFHRNRLPVAREVLLRQAQDWERLAVLAQRSTSRLATPIEPLDAILDAPGAPASYTVLATDGSQIEPDHHGIAEYFLINLGTVSIRYGPAPDARLETNAQLFFEDKDRFITDGSSGSRRVPVQDGHLAALRSVMELGAVVQLAGLVADDGSPRLALQDGTLLLWVLEQRPNDFIRDQLLRPYVGHLQRLREQRTPVASYISRPRSTEVSGLLREATCRGEISGCGPCRSMGDACALEALHDRELFHDLEIGQRSARFAVTLNPDLAGYYEDHRVHFFFLRVDEDEIARVEVPEWIASDESALGLVQSVILDQCQRGLGYPVAIARAHEKAIVTGADRSVLRSMIEATLAQAGIQVSSSAKQSSKRIHAV